MAQTLVSAIITGPIATALPARLAGRRAVVISDPMLIDRFGANWSQYGPVLKVPAGEAAKSLDVVSTLYHELAKLAVDRDTVLLGIGGGSVTDITGFVAATYLRGLPCGLVPTTLLAQVDAAIGGKNGINLAGVKNSIGTIRQPEFVLCDEAFLGSLPESERASGFAEIIKIACLYSKPLFDTLVHDADALWALGPGLRAVIACAAELKCGVVMRDEHEALERKKLNFGHTVGHALELELRCAHGAAVAAGMMLEAEFGVVRGVTDASVVTALASLLPRYRLAPRLAGLSPALWERIYSDKKRSGENIDLPFVTTLGASTVVRLPVQELLRFLCR